MKRIMNRLLAMLMVLALVMTFVPMMSVRAEENESQDNAYEESTERKQNTDLSINYFYVETPYLVTAPEAEENASVEDSGKENIAVSIGDGSENLTDVVLHYEKTDGTAFEMTEYEKQENVYLFSERFSENDNGSYVFTGIDYVQDEIPYSIVLSDIQIEAKFGVNEKYDGIDESDDLTSEQLAEVEMSVVSLDGKDDEEIENEIASVADNSATTVPVSMSEINSMMRTGTNKVVVLDPGHGGSDSGAIGVNGVLEKNLNLKIAQYCRDELSQYSSVTVKMTRDSDVYVGLSERVAKAKSYGANLFVSIHLNSTGNGSAYGAEVYYPNGNYSNAGNQYASSTGAGVSNNILNQLTSLGLENRGIKVRDCTNDERYPDGSLADYYSVINDSKTSGFPGIIVEHAFIDNSSDYDRFLSSDDKLRKLGIADAAGIAQYYGLSKSGNVVAVEEGTYTISSAINTKQLLTAESTEIKNGTAICSSEDKNAAVQRFEIISSDDGYYKIESESSGLVLDIPNGSNQTQTVLHLYSWNKSDAQKWRFIDAGNGYVYIQSALGTYMNMKDGTAQDGNIIWTYTNDQTNACKWKLSATDNHPVEDGTYYIKNSSDSTQVLDVSGGSIANGGNVQIYTSNQSTAQRYEISYAGNGYYKIASEKSGRLLDVTDANKNSGVNVQIWDANGNNAQLWKFVERENGTYYIKSKLGTTLSVDSTNAVVASMDGQPIQNWNLEKAEIQNVNEGTYVFQSLQNSNKVMSSENSNIVLQTFDYLSTQTYKVTYVSNGYYKIINRATGKSLDIVNGSAAIGANLQEYTWNGSSAQLWKFIEMGNGCYSLKSKCGTYVDIAGGSTADGTNIQMYSLNGSNAQKWKLNSSMAEMTDAVIDSGSYTIETSLEKNKILDIANGSFVNGANVQLYRTNNSLAQRFDIIPLGNGYYKIVSTISGKVLDIANGSKANGANVQLYTWNGSDAQQWRFIPAVDGEYYIKSKTGNVLDVSGANTNNGTNIDVYAMNQTSAQKWKLNTYEDKAIEEGTYTLASALAGNKVADVSGGSIANYANIQLYDANNSAAQHFVITSLGDGYYKIASELSGKVLDIASGSSAAGANVQLYTWNGSAAQKWKIISDGNNTVYLVSKLGTVLDVSNASTSNGTNIDAYTWNGSVAQKWTLKSVERQKITEGNYVISSAVNTCSVLTSKNSDIQIGAFDNVKTQKYSITEVSDGYYSVKNISTNKVLSIAGNSNQVGTNLEESVYNGSDGQLWEFVKISGSTYYIKSKFGTYIDLSSGIVTEGNNVQMYSFNAGDAQRWTLQSEWASFDEEKIIENGTYTFSSMLGNSQVLDITSASTANMANAEIYAGNNSSAQRFEVTYVSNGYYSIKAEHSDKALDIANGSKESKANVQQYTANSSDAQLWKFVPTGNGSYYIKSKMGTTLDVYSGVPKSGTNVQTYALNGATAQKWNLIESSYQPVKSGSVYQICTLGKMSMVADIDSASMIDGANLQLYLMNSTDAQKFVIEYQERGYYKITSKNSGKVLEVENGSSNENTNVQQAAWTGRDNQLWKFVSCGTDTYYIKSKIGTGLSLAAGALTNGTNIQTNTISYADTQKWILYSTSDLHAIMGDGFTSVHQMSNYFKSTNASYPYAGNIVAPTIEDFCRIYKEECEAEGVKTEVAFCQAMLETGFLKFGGDVLKEQYNFAGLGATGNGVKGNSFENIRIGVRAQIQHLKAYASTAQLIQSCVDERFGYVKRGTSPYVEWLGIQENPTGAGWAASKNYGTNILKYITNLKYY